MKGFLTLTLVLGITSIALGGSSLKVYYADEVTPFDCNSETMVGDKRVLVLSSDSNDYWSGGVFIEGLDRTLGILAGRDKDPNSRDWAGSHYAEAGDYAIVTQWQDSNMWGYDLFTFYPVHSNSVDNDNNTTVPGDWFVIDYYAEQVGECKVGLYEYNDYTTSWTEPNYLISFSNVPTRDLNSDDVVDFLDFAIFASQWDNAGCNDPNWCQGADIDRDGNVVYNDLSLFVKYWLWPYTSEGPGEPNGPQEPSYPEDPNFTYSIIDANGNSEITLDVNESITLYVDIATANGVSGVYAFHVEADISDTNLGSIDNTEYPDGTAQILAEPNKDPSWDYWKPGLEQEEGIQLTGFTTGCAIADGHLASFVFTCQSQGDVTLTLMNWGSWNTNDEEVFPKLESILIHQIDPYSQQMMESGGAAAQSAPPPEPDMSELIEWLEDLWAQEKEIRETYSKKEWDEFIDNLEDLYP